MVSMPSKNNPVNCPGRGCSRPDNPFKQAESFRKHVTKDHFGYQPNDPRAYHNTYTALEDQVFLDFLSSGGQTLPADCPKANPQIQTATAAVQAQMLPPSRLNALPSSSLTNLANLTTRKRKKDSTDGSAAQASSSQGSQQPLGGTDSPPRKLTNIDPQAQHKERLEQHIRGLHAMIHHVYSNQGQTSEYFSKLGVNDTQLGPRIHYGESEQEVNHYLLHRQKVADPQQRRQLIGKTFQEPANGLYDINSGKLLDPSFGSIKTSSTMTVDEVQVPVPVRKMPWVGINHSDYDSLFPSPTNPKTNIHGVVRAYIHRLQQYRTMYNQEPTDQKFNVVTRNVTPDDEQKLFGLQAFHNIQTLKDNPYFCIATEPTMLGKDKKNRMFFPTKQQAEQHAQEMGVRPEIASEYVAHTSQSPADGKYSLATKELIPGQNPLYIYQGDDNTNGVPLVTGQWLTDYGTLSPDDFNNPVAQIQTMQLDVVNKKRQDAERLAQAEAQQTSKIYIPLEDNERYQQTDVLATKRENTGVEDFIRSGGGPTRNRPGFPKGIPGDAPTPSDTTSVPATPSDFEFVDSEPSKDAITRQFEGIIDAPSPAFGTPAHYADTPANYATPRALSSGANTPPDVRTGKMPV